MEASGVSGAAAEEAAVAGSDESGRKQIRGSSLLVAGRVLSMAVGFGAQVATVRYLSKGDFGAFAYALSIATLATTVITFGLDRAITRFVPIFDEEGDEAKMAGSIALVAGTVLALGVCVVLLVYGLREAIEGSLVDDSLAVSLLMILILLAPLQALDELVIGLFAVFSRTRTIFFRRYVLAPALKVVVVLALVLSGSDAGFLAAGYVVAAGLGLLVYGGVLVRMLREKGLLQRFRRGAMEVPARRIFAFTLPLLSSDLVYVVMFTSDALLLGYYSGAAEVGAFRAILPLALLNDVVLASFGLLFTPLAARHFARGERGRINELYWQTALWTAVLSFPVFAVTFSLAEPVTVTLFGQRYASSAPYLSLLAVGYYFNALLGFNGLTLKVFGKLRYIVSINLFVVVVNLGLNFLLIPAYGALGAAIGTCATLIGFNILKQAGLRLGTGVSLFRQGFGGVYVVIAGATATLFVVQTLLSPPLVVGIALAAVASAAVILVSRRLLEVDDIFPELMRFPLARAIFGQRPARP